MTKKMQQHPRKQTPTWKRRTRDWSERNRAPNKIIFGWFVHLGRVAVCQSTRLRRWNHQHLSKQQKHKGGRNNNNFKKEACNSQFTFVTFYCQHGNCIDYNTWEKALEMCSSRLPVTEKAMSVQISIGFLKFLCDFHLLSSCNAPDITLSFSDSTAHSI